VRCTRSEGDRNGAVRLQPAGGWHVVRRRDRRRARRIAAARCRCGVAGRERADDRARRRSPKPTSLQRLRPHRIDERAVGAGVRLSTNEPAPAESQQNEPGRDVKTPTVAEFRKSARSSNSAARSASRCRSALRSIARRGRLDRRAYRLNERCSSASMSRGTRGSRRRRSKSAPVSVTEYATLIRRFR